MDLALMTNLAHRIDSALPFLSHICRVVERCKHRGDVSDLRRSFLCRSLLQEWVEFLELQASLTYGSWTSKTNSVVLYCFARPPCAFTLCCFPSFFIVQLQDWAKKGINYKSSPSHLRSAEERWYWRQTVRQPSPSRYFHSTARYRTFQRCSLEDPVLSHRRFQIPKSKNSLFSTTLFQKPVLQPSQSTLRWRFQVAQCVAWYSWWLSVPESGSLFKDSDTIRIHQR